MTFAERLKEMRYVWGFSHSEMATQAGLSHSHIYALESRGVSPTIRTLDRIAAAFGISTMELLRPIYRPETECGREVKPMGNIEVRRYPPECGHIMPDGSLVREWDGYIQPEDRSWIAFVNVRGEATFFLEREPSGAVVMP